MIRRIGAAALLAVGCAGPTVNVVVNGDSAGAWNVDRLRSVPRVRAVGYRGHAQKTWRLIDVVHMLIGEQARVVAVVDDDGKRRIIRDADWADGKRVLVLGLGYKDFFKVERLFPDGSYEEPVAKGVETIEISK